MFRLNTHVPNFKGAYFLISLFTLFISCRESQQLELKQEAPFFSEAEQLYKSDLLHCIQYLDSLSQGENREAFAKYYLEARMYFKYAEPILAFSDVSNYRYLNQPNIVKVDEDDYTDIKVKEPSGFQVLEELIFADSLDTEAVKKHALQTRNRLKLIHTNTFLKPHQSYHFLWLLRNEINRIALTGITGFDSPVLENSLEEAAFVYKRLKDYLALYQDQFNDPALFAAWNSKIDQSIASLEGDFNAFDRYGFIKNHTHAELTLWIKTVKDWQVQFPFTMAIQNEASSLFSEETFNLKYFTDPHSGEITDEKVQLGKQLFRDSRLSASGAISCANCHQQPLAFTDGEKLSEGQSRNSPTLTYAGLQQGFFYDSRSGSLEGQVISVVNNATEFHTSLDAMTAAVQKDSTYEQAFKQLYADSVSERNIRNAIASYIQSLASFNSRFDRNISGQEESLTTSEIRGFNLFTGKAKCATCHFAPVFNGTVPPEFTETEMELLGVPAENDTLNATIDPDMGRYNVYKTAERKFFFKTPTVRNSALTAPYMHNGVYATLEEVMDFYNRGGGAGIGIEEPYQTLPPDPLNLNEQEVQDVIAFLHALTDASFIQADKAVVQ